MSKRALTYKKHRFPVSIVACESWLYFCFNLSLREVEEMMLERGVVVSYETIRRCVGRIVRGSRGNCAARRPRLTISGILMKWLFSSVARNACYGARLIKMDMCSMKSSKPVATLGVWSRHLMDWIESESFGLLCPDGADIFIRREASKCLETSGKVIC
jgi:hypothetical protein